MSIKTTLLDSIKLKSIFQTLIDIRKKVLNKKIKILSN